MAALRAPVPGVLACFVLLVGVSAASAVVERSLSGLPTCPAVPPQLSTCDSEDLGPELLTDHLLTTVSSSSSSWNKHLSQANLATFASAGIAGTEITVQEHVNPQAYDVILYRSVPLDQSATYELCLQGGAAGRSGDIRFAVDGGASLNFAVAGGGQRAHLELASGRLTSGCFRFSLPGPQSSNYTGRVALEFGTLSGSAVLCQASLRRCATPQVPLAGLCPSSPAPLDAWRCSESDLGEELLADSTFAVSGAWHKHTWRPDGAEFNFGAPGMMVNVEEHEGAQLYDAQVYQTVPLNASGGASYELCLQANTTGENDQIRFAVDGGQALNFTTAGGGKQRTFMDVPKGYLTTSCFRFTLPDSPELYPGRVDIEFGTAQGRVALCQASLRRCHAPITRAPNPQRRCYFSPLIESRDCKRLATLTGPDFALNSYGHETTAARRCLQRARNASADAFELKPGECRLWSCGSRENLISSAWGSPDGTALYSEHCQYGEVVGGLGGSQTRSHVFVQLWDWNFPDVGRECEEYLGPNGFSGVQVAPVTEHILGGTWWTKYQPVSYRLDSRSGTKAQFEDMVTRCRRAGVEVMVDVILNHMARPCDAVQKVGRGAGMPCVGWAGSRYGNRRAGGVDGWPLMTPEDFHHLRADDLRNCPVEQETFQCPTSVPPNDCSMCDLYGMPDWRTEESAVQEMLWEHLEELHDLGVTMLRLDAASYMHPEDLAAFMNRAPWDFVVQEWWGGVPTAERSHFVGHYRDYNYGLRIVQALTGDASKLTDLLQVAGGNKGVPPEQAVSTLTDHDQKSTVSYKSGLEYHQQQKWLLAWPEGMSVRLFGGFGWATTEDGPPGCEVGDERCSPTSVFSGPGGEAACMSTPQRSPLDLGLADRRVWICEHRWEGVAGLINFRAACRGLPVQQTWVDTARGSLAFQAGESCFAALQKGYNREVAGSVRRGDWSLVGMEVGLAAGRYCDLASLPTQSGWLPQRCPREVIVAADGRVLIGSVPEGDVLAIHAGALLPNTTDAYYDDPAPGISLAAGEKSKPTSFVQGWLLLLLLASIGFA